MQHAQTSGIRVNYRPWVELLEARELLSGTGFSPEALQERFTGQLYEDLLGRSSDQAGQAFWMGLLQQGASLGQVANGIDNSTEYKAIVLQEAYRTLLHRPLDQGGLNSF